MARAKVEIELPKKTVVRGGILALRAMTPKRLREAFERYPEIKAAAPSCGRDGMVERSLRCTPADPRRFKLAEDGITALEAEWRQVEALLDAIEKPFGLDHLDQVQAARLVSLLWSAWSSLGLAASKAPDEFPRWALAVLPHLSQMSEAATKREWRAWYDSLPSQPIRIEVGDGVEMDVERVFAEVLPNLVSLGRKVDPDKLSVFTKPVPKAVTVAELIDAYENSEKRKVMARHVDEANANNTAAFRVFRDVLGADRMVHTLTPHDIDKVSEIILALPPGAHNVHLKEGKSFVKIADEAIKRRNADPKFPRGVNGLSLRKYYGAINALLRFGARVGWVPALLEIDHSFTAKAKGNTKAKSRRSALSLAQLQRLFHRSYFDDADGTVQAVNRWIPLVALYQGARMGEVAQLDVLDVRLDNESGGWVINFTEDGSRGKRLKTDASWRNVPLHPELERLGFIEFVRRRQGEGREKLFNVRGVSDRGKVYFYGSVRDGLTAMMKAAEVYQRHVYTPNSMRHTWRACALSQKVLNEHRNVLGGWELDHDDDAEDYGNAQPNYGRLVGGERFAFPVADLRESLEMVRYAGLFQVDPPEGWRPASYERCSSKEEPKPRLSAEEKAEKYELKKLRERRRLQIKRLEAKKETAAAEQRQSAEAEAAGV